MPSPVTVAGKRIYSKITHM